MTAVLVPTANEAEWLAGRRQGVTASEIAVLMGLSPWDSPYALYHRKRGDLPEQEENAAMGLGKHMESYVAGEFDRDHPYLIVRGDGRSLYAHPERPWQMATPDRLVYEAELCGACDAGLPMGCTCEQEHGDPLAVLECKIDGGSDGWGEEGTDEIPVHYRCQVLWQMDVMGVETGFVACLLWHRRQVRVYEITKDAAAIADLFLMVEEARSFLECVERGIEPDVDWRPATGAALKHLHPDVADVDVAVRRMPIIQYRAACKAYKAAEQRKKLAENRLRDLLGSGHRIVSVHTGEVIARRDVYDVKEHTRRASHVDKLVPVKPKEPKS